LKDRRYLTFPQLFALLMLGGGLYFFLGIGGLHLWAQGQENARGRAFLTSVTAPVKELADRAGVSPPLSAAKERFHTLKDKPFDLSAIRATTPQDRTPPGTSERVAETAPVHRAPGAAEKAVPSPGKEKGITASEAPDGPVELDPVPASGDAPGGILMERTAVTVENSVIEHEDPRAAPPEEEDIPPPGSPVSREDGDTGSLPYKILLMGDSLANSTATALVPLAEQVPGIILMNHGKVSSNLSNPVFTDWFAEVDTILEAHQFHTILLMLGANAAQSISVENREVLWDTPEWNLIYRERAAKLIEKLKAHTERVFWVGIPPMLNRGYRERMERQNQIIREICTAQGIFFLPIDTVMGDQNGKYTDYKTLEGRQIKLRLSDNIHYSPAGADLLSRHLLNELYPDLPLPPGR
jgi:hypothetical protein